MKSPTPDPRCGSHRGYVAHHRRGEDACFPCQEANRLYGIAWRRRNPDYYRTWYAVNAEAQRAKTARYLAANPEYGSKWTKANADKNRAKEHRRRTRLRGGEVEMFEEVEIFERDAWICQLCQTPINPDLI